MFQRQKRCQEMEKSEWRGESKKCHLFSSLGWEKNLRSEMDFTKVFFYIYSARTKVLVKNLDKKIEMSFLMSLLMRKSCRQNKWKSWTYSILIWNSPQLNKFIELYMSFFTFIPSFQNNDNAAEKKKKFAKEKLHAIFNPFTVRSSRMNGIFFLSFIHAFFALISYFSVRMSMSVQ